MIEIILILILMFFALLSVALSLPHILQMQIAEYLFYKYRGMIKESGYVRSLIPLGISMPAKSPRNILIALFLLLFQLSVAVGLFFLLSANVLLVLTAFPVFWISGKIAVVLGVVLTAPLAYLFRARIIFLARRQLERSDVKIVAVTGSYGKSSVKEIIHRILSARFLTGKTRWNRNTDVGIALEMALQVSESMEYFVAEMGAYRRGDISRLCRMYKPKYSVLTGLGNQHLSMFGSREGIVKEKSEILKAVPRGGVGYLNADVKDYEEVLKVTGNRIVTYGLNSKADAVVSGISFNGERTEFTLKYKGKKENYEIGLLGEHSVVNSLPAILLAKELGMRYSYIFDVLREIEPLLGKLSVHEGFNGSTLLNDSYNSNVDGFLAAVKVLKSMDGKEKYISTLGILELGSDKEVSYKLVLIALKGSGINLLTTDKQFASLGLYENVSVYETEGEILERLREVANDESVVLIEGRHTQEFTKSLGLEKAY
jgi:UDP-N-acetylmuramyl pentapeptide synthase